MGVELLLPLMIPYAFWLLAVLRGAGLQGRMAFVVLMAVFYIWGMIVGDYDEGVVFGIARYVLVFVVFMLPVLLVELLMLL